MKPVRIVDLGASDGYVSLWLARQLRAAGAEAIVDVVELEPSAREQAARRLAEDGIEGVVVDADVRDAPKHLEAGTYDVAIMYELIEHVPKPAELLAAAEALVKPDGLVFISTPDGVFGPGNNAQHLAAYRAQDLADMLRRRGELADMAVGPDGVTTAAYTPMPRKGDVAIYCGPGAELWSPHDIERRGLGGSETAAVRLAEQLSALGFVVTVYASVEQCAYRDVIFKSEQTFDPMERHDVVISSRIPEVFDRPVNARTRMLWCHDTDFQDRLTGHRADRIQHILCLSRWHVDHMAGLYPFAKDKLRQIRNGIELAYFAGPAPVRERRVVYTSSPDRGLDKLLEWWPRIRERVPDAELHCCYSAVYDSIAKINPLVGAHYRKLEAQVAELEGVTRLGSLSQPEVAKLMRSSAVWAHPSWMAEHWGDAPFYETSCIAAMEAQAAGCVVVASDWGALSETVRAGRLVGSEKWDEAFVDEIVDGLVNPETQSWAATAGPVAAAELGWDGVAEQVAGLIDGQVEAFVPALV